MVAIGLHEAHRDATLDPQTVAQQRVAQVCSILNEADDDAIELSLEEVEWVTDAR